MSKVYRARARPLVVAALVAVGALASAGSASAQSVFFSGYTEGCFGVACAPSSGVSVLGGLTYTPNYDAGPPISGFAVTTVDGLASIGGQTNNFGRFALSGSPFSYTGQSFTLLITFIDPASSQNTFMAALTGAVLSDDEGGVFIDFDNVPQFWSNGASTYSVAVNDLDITPGEDLVVSGRVTATTVPEPISLVLLGSGLLGLGVVRRRRTKVNEADLI